MTAGLARAGLREIRSVPLADGGEGTLDALLGALGGKRRSAVVSGPLGDRVEAEYAVLRDGTAVIEMARASGLGLVDTNEPLDATTAGTGELILAAVNTGASRVIVTVGGSATTDGGLGALQALGWNLRGADVSVACDVSTPFLDAATVYGPQKGATPSQVGLLSRRLERLAGDFVTRTGVDVTAIAGAGAAGGLAGGLAAIGARLEPGFEVVARAAGLEDALDGAGLVVTGEGALDAGSFAGKVVGGVLRWCEQVPIDSVGVIAGAVAADVTGLVPSRVRVESLADRAFDEGDSFARAALLVEEAALDLGRWAIGEGSSGKG